MNFVTDINNPKQEEIQALLDYVNELMEKEELIIVPRKKNNDFIINYNLVKPNDVYKILKKLTVNHFCKCQISEEAEYAGELLYIFKIVENLMDFEGDTEDVEIYVKFGKYKTAKIADISFHGADYEMTLYEWR